MPNLAAGSCARGRAFGDQLPVRRDSRGQYRVTVSVGSPACQSAGHSRPVWIDGRPEQGLVHAAADFIGSHEVVARPSGPTTTSRETRSSASLRGPRARAASRHRSERVAYPAESVSRRMTLDVPRRPRTGGRTGELGLRVEARISVGSRR
jgi:hypothetical protein